MNIYEKRAQELAKKGQVHAALKRYQEAAQAYISQGENLSLSRMQVRLALLAEQTGNPKSAEDFYHQARLSAQNSPAPSIAAEHWTAEICFKHAKFLDRQSGRDLDALDILDLALFHLDKALEMTLKSLDAPENQEDFPVKVILASARKTLDYFYKLSGQMLIETGGQKEAQ